MFGLPREMFQNEIFPGNCGPWGTPNPQQGIQGPQVFNNVGPGFGGGFGGGFGANPLALLALGFLAGRYLGRQQQMVPQFYIIDGAVKK